jgi:hypothetical protein
MIYYLKKVQYNKKRFFTASHSGILINKPSLFAALGITYNKSVNITIITG